MRADDETLLYLGLGPLAAIVLGVALVPLRELTTASNLTFAFLIWTILVGELGGRSAAVATALTSAFPVSALAVRDSEGRLLARSGGAEEQLSAPSLVVQADTLLPGGPGRLWPGRSAPLPPEGARVALVAGNLHLGWLDLWGDGRPASDETRRALSTVARVAAALVALPARGPRE